jgi:hypothetical protein
MLKVAVGEAFTVGFAQCNKKKWLRLEKTGVDMKATGGLILRAKVRAHTHTLVCRLLCLVYWLLYMRC